MAKYAPEHTIGCFSFSKCASIPGLRIGYMYANEEIIDAVEKLQQYTILCPNAFSQAIALKFLEGKIYPDYVKKTVIPTYKSRKQAMSKALRKYLPKATFSEPRGAFYIFPDMSAYLGNKTEEEFCTWILDKAHVAMIPGNYFGNKCGQNHIRFTFVSETEKRIEQGIKRIGELVE